MYLRKWQFPFLPISFRSGESRRISESECKKGEPEEFPRAPSSGNIFIATSTINYSCLKGVRKEKHSSMKERDFLALNCYIKAYNN